MKLALVCILSVALAACAARSTSQDTAIAPSLGDQLLGSRWRLEDLGGVAVLDRVEATLTFPEPGRLAGKASCNRFVGTVEIDGGLIHIGRLALTRRLCRPPAIKQEARYLKALETAERITLDGPNLLIYATGIAKPLRYARK